jgi:hypothetical protein
MHRTPTEVIPRIPDPVRKVVRNTIWASGRLTARWRGLPDFLVIGAQKAGTTALYAYLRWHPAILGPFWKEVSFFDRHWAKGEEWYRGQLPLRSEGRLVGEASPSYVFHPLAAERVYSIVPDVRLIMLLREPGDRAYSQYQHAVALGREALSFEDALAAEDERVRGEVERLRADPKAFSFAWWNQTYASRGLYADQLARWFELFPREHVLALTTEELGARPAETYASVLSFLGAEPHVLDSYPRVFDRDYPPMRTETREALTARFAEPNRRLERLLGRPLGWPV